MISDTGLDAFYESRLYSTSDAFPPACLRSHWDPTMMANHILPAEAVPQPLPLDPRQAVRICTSYYQLARPAAATDALNLRMYATPAQDTPAALLGGPKPPGLAAARDYLPFGGAARHGVPTIGMNPDVESDLFRKNELLTRCSERRYMPAGRSPATSAHADPVQGAAAPTSTYSEVVAGPETPTLCRAADDRTAWAASPRAFYNSTRYDRTGAGRSGASGVVLPYPAWA
jgi:hypothetical protein